MKLQRELHRQRIGVKDLRADLFETVRRRGRRAVAEIDISVQHVAEFLGSPTTPCCFIPSP
jgi:hypothetical protein